MHYNLKKYLIFGLITSLLFSTTLFGLTKNFISANTIPEDIYNAARNNKLTNATFNQRIIFYVELLQDIDYGHINYVENFNSSYSPKQYLIELFNKDEFTYIFNKFDCVTYIETVLALAYIEDKADLTTYKKFQDKFEAHLKAIRYQYSTATFWHRNHFTATEWFPNNHLLFSPVTTQLSSEILVALAFINRTGWVYKFKFEQQYKKDFTEDNLHQLIISIQNDEAALRQVSSIPYIPIDINNIKKLTTPSIIKKWPEVSIVNIVRTNWDLTATIGTELNISHQGLVIKQKDTMGKYQLYFMHATSVDLKKTTKILLTDYLSKFLDHETIKGINVYSINNAMKEHLSHNSE